MLVLDFSTPSVSFVTKYFCARILYIAQLLCSTRAHSLLDVGGEIMTVPGLPTRPGFFDVDIDVETGQVIGLF